MRPTLSLVLVAILALAGCQSPTNSSKTITLRGAGWYIQNCPTDLWSDTTTPYLFYELGLGFSDNTTASDLTEARISLADDSWGWTLKPATFNESTHVWGSYQTNLYWGTNTAALPLGNLKVTVVLANGQTLTTTLPITQPGSTTTGPVVVVSEDCTTTYTNSVKALARPTSVTAVRSTTAGTLTVQFVENDSRAYNGWVWLFDSSGTYLGGYFYFRSPTTQTVTSKLNAGAFAAAGSVNTLTLQTSDLPTGVTPAAVSQVRVIVTDGGQYSSSTDGVHYDYRSISALGSVTGN